MSPPKPSVEILMPNVRDRQLVGEGEGGVEGGEGWGWRDWAEQKQIRALMDMDNSVVVVKMGWVEVEEGIQSINGDEKN